MDPEGVNADVSTLTAECLLKPGPTVGVSNERQLSSACRSNVPELVVNDGDNARKF